MKTVPMTLGEAAQFINGFAFGPEHWGTSGLPIIRIQNLTGPDKPFTRTTATVLDRYLVRPGDLLVSWSATLGVFEWNRLECGLVNQHIFRVVPNEAIAFKPYLKHAISQAIRSMERFSHGSTMRHINREEFLATKIWLPELDEQKRIAAILDKAEAIRRKREQFIKLADEFLRSLFLEMFGDPVSNPKGWPTKKLFEFGEVTTGNTPSRENNKYYDGDIEWIKSDNLNTPNHVATKATEFLSEEGAKRGRPVPSGSILITCIAGSPQCIGNAALIDRKVAFNQQINAIVPNDSTDSHFLYTQFLVGKKLVQNSSTASMKGMVSKGRFEQIVFLSPSYEIQRAFGAQVQELFKLRSRAIEHYAEALTLQQSLTRRAFLGEL